jgi:hypothetical protein
VRDLTVFPCLEVIKTSSAGIRLRKLAYGILTRNLAVIEIQIQDATGTLHKGHSKSVLTDFFKVSASLRG